MLISNVLMSLKFNDYSMILYKRTEILSEMGKMGETLIYGLGTHLVFGTAQVQYLLESFITCCQSLHKLDTQCYFPE
jgi:hypothetical protein